VNYRFVTFACASAATSSTTAPSTIAPSASQSPPTGTPTPSAEVSTAVSPGSEGPTAPGGEFVVLPESVAVDTTPDRALAFTGTDVFTMTALGFMTIVAGLALLRWRQGARRPGA
jgi:hypothetical protein